MLDKVTAAPFYGCEQLGGLALLLPMRSGHGEPVRHHGKYGDEQTNQAHQNQCDSEDLKCDHDAAHRFLISRTKIQMIQNPQVMQIMKQSRRNLPKP